MADGPAPLPHDQAAEDEVQQTFVYSGPIFPPGYAAAPADSEQIIARASPQAQRQLKTSGEERFEHMLRYCLTLLHQAQGKICAFYIDDFPGSDETLLRLAQELIGRSGYVTSDFRKHGTGAYKGFWAWRAKS